MRRGFTLLELSIVLALIGVIVGGGLVVFTASVQTAQFNATVEKMNALDKALLNYRVAFNRLPCPASLTLTPTSVDYGEEAGWDSSSSITTGTGVCTGTGMVPQANYSGADTDTVAEGAVPTRALRLPDSYMYDGWGRRFRYAVDVTMTATNAFTTTSILPSTCSTTAISISDASDVITSRTASAIYAIISHGANGHGGYTTNGVAFNAGSTNTDEKINCHCDSSASFTSYTPHYVQKLPTVDSSSALDNFDDLVSFKTLAQMQTQATSETTVGCPYLYVTEYTSDTVRQIQLWNGYIYAFAGKGSYGNSYPYSGQATSSYLALPYQTAFDSSGNLIITSGDNNVVVSVTPAGVISDFAGLGTSGFSGDSGAATSAALSHPDGVAKDASGNIYLSDCNNHRVRKVTFGTGIITTIAGTGTSGYTGDGGLATAAELNCPNGLAMDSSGNLYIADSGNDTVREMNTSTGIIITLAGNGTYSSAYPSGSATSQGLGLPCCVALNSTGQLYITDGDANLILALSGGTLSVVAGTGSSGYSGDGGQATAALLNHPGGIAFDSSNNLYIADYGNNRIRRVSTTGVITTIAGTGSAGYTGNGGAATSAQMNGPNSLTFLAR